MNEEIKAVEAIEEPIEAIEVIEDTVPSGNGFAKVLAVGAVAVAGVVVALVYKNRNKFEEMQIRRLEKKGYKITKEVDSENAVEADFTDYDDAE